MGPGPSNPYPEVAEAFAQPLLGHLDPAFLTILDETVERLRQVFRTRNRLTLPVSGTGSAGMEAAFVNVLGPGDVAVIGVNGVFGARMCDVEVLGREKGDALVVVDCVTSLGGIPVEVDAWGIDIAYSGTQKCLGVPPGLAPLTVSDRAIERFVERSQSWYLDLRMIA